jgi:SAM-dependent methyltransferase
MSGSKALRSIKDTINRSLRVAGVEIRGLHDWSDTAQFIPFEKTVQGAADAGLSVGDYIDTVMNHIPGATQATIDGMQALGVFKGPLSNILEIGPGSGRYLEKTLQYCRPQRYEIYETAAPWASYLQTKYAVVLRPTDGHSLAPTPDASVDLAQAHKVFNGINLLTTLGYWRELVRVTKPSGWVVFDIITEDCLPPETMDGWIDSGFQTGAYPSCVPRSTCLGYFQSRGFDLVGTFFGPIGPGRAETFVLRKRSA